MVNKVKFIKDPKEPNDVYIGRGSKWGNPFIIGKDGDRELVISKYAKYLVSKPELMRDIKSLKDKNLVCFCSPSKVTDTHKVVIVSGTAKGADKLGELYAKNKSYPVHPFPADWHLHGKSAGYKRNKRMAQYADALVAFYDGSSKGTGHMINLAKDYISEPMNIHVHVYKTQPQLELFSSTGAIK